MPTMQFSCACGKGYHVNSSYAGSTFTCSACNATMAIPPSPAPPPRPPRRKNLVFELAGPILAGLAVAGIVLYVAGWYFDLLPANPLPGWRKKLEDGAASGAPPPVAFPPPKHADLGDNAKDTAGIVFALAMLGVGGVAALFPLLLPVVLSRRGHLSVSRWVILAVFFALVSGIGFTVTLGFSALAGATRLAKPDDFNTAAFLLKACATGAAYSLVAVLGCLLAGAFYPKKDG